jgi:Ca2+/H+ antiporter
VGVYGRLRMTVLEGSVHLVVFLVFVVLLFSP